MSDNQHPALRLADSLESQQHPHFSVMAFFRDAADYLRTLYAELQQYRCMVARLLHDIDKAERNAIHLEACNELLTEATWRLLRAEPGSADWQDACARALRAAQLARKPAQEPVQ